MVKSSDSVCVWFKWILESCWDLRQQVDALVAASEGKAQDRAAAVGHGRRLQLQHQVRAVRLSRRRLRVLLRTHHMKRLMGQQSRSRPIQSFHVLMDTLRTSDLPTVPGCPSGVWSPGGSWAVCLWDSKHTSWPAAGTEPERPGKRSPALRVRGQSVSELHHIQVHFPSQFPWQPC